MSGQQDIKTKLFTNNTGLKYNYSKKLQLKCLVLLATTHISLSSHNFTSHQSSLISGLQSLFNVAYQIVGALNAHGQPDHAISDAH